MSQVIAQTPLQKSRWFKVTMFAALGVGMAVVFFLVFIWPFRPEAIIKELEDESLSKLTAGAFHRTYFPP